VADVLADADATGVGARVEAALEEAERLAGPDVGSPVLHVDGGQRGFFGPIVSPAPTGEQADALFDAVVTLQDLDPFFEVKRGRGGPPAL
jgi:hypothetical protein